MRRTARGRMQRHALAAACLLAVCAVVRAAASAATAALARRRYPRHPRLPRPRAFSEPPPTSGRVPASLSVRSVRVSSRRSPWWRGAAPSCTGPHTRSQVRPQRCLQQRLHSSMRRTGAASRMPLARARLGPGRVAQQRQRAHRATARLPGRSEGDVVRCAVLVQMDAPGAAASTQDLSHLKVAQAVPIEVPSTARTRARVVACLCCPRSLRGDP